MAAPFRPSRRPGHGPVLCHAPPDDAPFDDCRQIAITGVIMGETSAVNFVSFWRKLNQHLVTARTAAASGHRVRRHLYRRCRALLRSPLLANFRDLGSCPRALACIAIAVRGQRVVWGAFGPDLEGQGTRVRASWRLVT